VCRYETLVSGSKFREKDWQDFLPRKSPCDKMQRPK
jgi:hypothetical protein